jgi:ABC-2 type transport system ATP-binding protein
MISVKDLSKKYGNFTAISGLSFEIKPGEIVGLLGPNGAGKSTTLKILSGYLRPTQGSVKINEWHGDQDGAEIKKLIGYLPETNPLYEDLKVDEYLNFVAQIKNVPKEKRQERLKNILKKTSLIEKEHQLISQLSKGYKQRVGLAAALINDPEILILDEPTEGLDPNQRIEIRALIKELGRQRTVILSSHILPEIEAVCDRVIIIHQGKLVAVGTLGELKAKSKKTTRVHLTVSGPTDQVLSAVKSQAGVERVIESKKEGDFTNLILETDSTLEVRNALVKMCVEKGWDVFEVTEEEQSLEDVFVGLTNS